MIYEDPYSTNLQRPQRQARPNIAIKPMMNRSHSKPSRNIPLAESKQNRTFEKPLYPIKPLSSSVSDQYLPDLGHFKQGLTRPEDMETEERALMNLYAKDYDDLKILDLVKGNDDLYNHKLNQYKSSSSQRIDAEK